MQLARKIVRLRVPILVLALLLLIPSVFGMAATRINYDMLTYLPEDMETVIGQDELMKDFGKCAFSFIIVEGMEPEEVSRLRKSIEGVEHVDSVIWYDSLADLSVPMELLPDQIYQAFNTDNATVMAVFFDSSTSADVTMEAVDEIRSICGKQCFVAGMSALVLDLKQLCEQEEPIYVALAVVLAAAAMTLLLDCWLAPLVFLACIGMMVLGLGGMCAGLSVVAKKLKKGWLIPVFVLCFFCYMAMGYLASRGGNSAADNWIEQGVNTVGQILLLVGVAGLHRAGLRDYQLS